jgi:hypothetical protein
LADADLIENLDHERNVGELRGTGGEESSRNDNLESPRTETPGGPSHFNGRSDVHASTPLCDVEDGKRSFENGVLLKVSGRTKSRLLHPELTCFNSKSAKPLACIDFQ